MEQFRNRLERYAALAVEIGVNVRPGQPLCVFAPISSAELVREIVKHAYKIGAKYVHVEWGDEWVARARIEHSAEDDLNDFPAWIVDARVAMAEQGSAFLHVVAENPNAMLGVAPDRIALATKAQQQKLQPFRRYTLNNICAWTIVAYPSAEWADKVFPDLPADSRRDALWEAIFAATRANEEDALELWKTHVRKLEERADALNGKRFKELRYRAPGTDLTVGLPEGHLWKSAASRTAGGVTFVPNMPTEEVFTSPHRDRVSGTVTASKPLSYAGKLIENFSFTFEEGKIVDFSAEKEYDTLKKLVETDDGSRRLGEIALVPHRSPISDTNLLFYNTLFDENAACHLAIGFGFPFCLQGGLEMSKESLLENGLNHSLTHVDFMIGTADLSIDGIKADGSSEPIFREGNWAF